MYTWKNMAKKTPKTFYIIYTMSKKNCAKLFLSELCEISTVKTAGTKMAKMISLREVHSFSTSPNLCQCTTVLNTDVPHCS